VFSSNLTWDATVLTELIFGFSQSLQAHACVIPRFSHSSFPSDHFQFALNVSSDHQNKSVLGQKLTKHSPQNKKLVFMAFLLYAIKSIEVEVSAFNKLISTPRRRMVECLPTAAARLRARVLSSGIYGGQSGAGAGFLQVLRFPLPIFIPPDSPSS
jgi:hypothetical protein